MSGAGPQSDVGWLGLCAWAVRYALRHPGLLAGAVVLRFVQAAVEVMKPWPVVFLVDYVLQPQAMPGWLKLGLEPLPGTSSPTGFIGWAVAATFLLFLLGWAVGLGRAYLDTGLGQGLLFDLAGDLFHRLQQLSLQAHTRRRVGDDLSRLTSDAACLSKILLETLLPLGSAALTLLAMAGLLWRLDAMLTLVALVVVPLMALGFRRYAQPMLDKSYHLQTRVARLYEEAEQTLSGLTLIQALGRESDQQQRLRQVNRDSLGAALALTRVQLKFRLWMGASVALGTAAILWMGTRHVLAGELTIGALVLFLSYLASFYEPVKTVMYTGVTLQSTAGSARRVREVFAVPQEISEAPGAAPLTAVQGHVRLEQVTFGYDTDRPPVLREVCLEMKPGQVVALVGPTGAGKSTLASLLPRFHDPWSGTVTMDGTDLRRVQLRSLREQVSLVLQEPILFPMSVAANITYGRPHAARGEIVAAAQAACAHEFISRLPRGYDTILGERGLTLSGGERQRLAMARALLKDAPLLILDEPTSALDPATEGAMMEALHFLMRRRTTLLIAHRLSTVRHADLICVLEGGRITARGTHRELLAAGGAYAHWCRLQTGSGPSPQDPTQFQNTL